jgi:hypothetical protein
MKGTRLAYLLFRPVSRPSSRVSGPPRRSSQRVARGITRVELVLLTAIGSVVLGAGVLWLNHESSETANKQALKDAQEILDAANTWKKTNGTLGCPTISQLIQDRRLEKTARADDPWGHRYQIQCDSDELRVHSLGLDGKPNTADDIHTGTHS